MTNTKDIKIIVVGAGYGGMAAAIELTRKGCSVTIFESTEKLTTQGDAILLAPNATRLINKWDGVLPQLEAMSGDRSKWTIHDTNGKILLEQIVPGSLDGLPTLSSPRGQVQKLMYEYATSLGVQFVLGARISEYFEDEYSAGVYANGKKYEADAVIAADGVHSKGRAYITKEVEKPTQSGFGIFRSILPLKNLVGHPLTEEFGNIKEDKVFVWIGDDIHCIVSINLNIKSAGFFITHKDNSRGEENWNRPGNVEDMLAIVQTWDPRIAQVIKSIPKDAVIDFKLIWRNPVTKWISDGGRVALAGDAAHPHLATAGTGGAQAIEDGFTLGAVVDRAGKENIPLALKAYSRLRYERTSLTQRMGWETRRRWHQTDWEAVKTNAEYLKLPQPVWLTGADAEQYAYANYDAVVSFLEKGTPFESTNLPKGYVHKDWTIESLLELERSGAANEFLVKDD